MTQSPWYRISQVSKLTGLSAQLIRKWEERYGAVQPKRLVNGYRVYSASDVALLKRIQSYVASGYAVSDAVDTCKAGGVQSEDFWRSAQPSVDNRGEEFANTEPLAVSNIVHTLYQACMVGDARKIVTLLQRSQAHYSTTIIAEAMIVPFLHRVGNAYADGQLSEYQEHLASGAVRDYLIQARTQIPEEADAPLVLGACLPEERHEIPIHLMLLLARTHGWRTTFLGASPAKDAIEMATLQLQPRIVLLTATTALPFQHGSSVLEQLNQFAQTQPNTMFYLGGQGVEMYVGNITDYKALRLAKGIRDVFDAETR